MTETAQAGWPAAANALAAILQAENDALRALDFTAASCLLPKKRAALQALDGLVGNAPQAILRESLARLDRLTAENRALLQRGIHIQSQVLGIIASAAQAAAAQGYGSSGRSAHQRGAYMLSARA